MYIDVFVSGARICGIKLLDQQAPNLSKLLLDALPIHGRITHAKLSGSVIFFTLPFIAPWENYALFEDVPKMRPQGSNRGAVCINNAAQHFCIAYNDDVIPEPLGMSYVGDVVDGLTKLETVGIRSWIRQGEPLSLVRGAGPA